MRRLWCRARYRTRNHASAHYFITAFCVIFIISILLIMSSRNILRQDRSSTTGIGLLDYSKCKPCNSLLPKYGNSKPSDLIISGVFGQEKRAAKFLRTLRAVGCRASVVFVTNKTVPSSIIKDFQNCGAEFFEMKTSPAMHHFYPHSLRYIGYKQFFDFTGRRYDRVFHSDAYDVFFQGDPFTNSIENDRLYFVMEDVAIKNSTWNSGWIVRAYNETTLHTLENFTVSCSGTVIGGYEQFMRYLVTMLNHVPFWMNGRHSLDQAYHNYLLHSGEFKRAGVTPEFLGCNSHILTMHYCSRNRKHMNDNSIVGPDGTTVPAVVHQYNIFRDTHPLLKRLCA